MNGRFSVTTFNDPGFFQGKRSCVAAFGENEHLFVDPAVGMQAGREFGKDFGVGIHHSRSCMCRPALKKNVTSRYPRLDVDLQSANLLVGLAPGGGSEFAERVVFRANTLQVQKQVPLAVSSARVAVGQVTRRRHRQQTGQQLTHAAHAKNKMPR